MTFTDKDVDRHFRNRIVLITFRNGCDIDYKIVFERFCLFDERGYTPGLAKPALCMSHIS